MTLRRISTSDPASTMDIHAAIPVESVWICFQEVDNVVFEGGSLFRCDVLFVWFQPPPNMLLRLFLHAVFYIILLQNYTSGVSKYYNLFRVGLQYCLLGAVNMKINLELDPKGN